jgi:hypothetical protein
VHEVRAAVDILAHIFLLLCNLKPSGEELGIVLLVLQIENLIFEVAPFFPFFIVMDNDMVLEPLKS